MIKNLGKIESEAKFSLTNTEGTTYFKESNGRYYYCFLSRISGDYILRWHRTRKEEFENANFRFKMLYGEV